MQKTTKIALVGNPNSGKSSLFNELTGLNQRVGNFPGVTVDKKIGRFDLENGKTIELIDFPGTYSLYPKSMDERVVTEILFDQANNDYPDAIIVVADATNLKRHLLLFTEIADLMIPTILVLNMMDEVEKEGIEIDFEELKNNFNVEVLGVSAREGKGLEELKALLSEKIEIPKKDFYTPTEELQQQIQAVKTICDETNGYTALQILHQSEELPFLSAIQKQDITAIRKEIKFDSNLRQVEETLKRYQLINDILITTYSKKRARKTEEFSNKLDSVLTHKYFGLPIFFAVIFFIFQGIFTWASYPMDLIDGGFSWLNSYLQSVLPDVALTSLLTDGLISGLGGIIIFIPQIAILFAFIAILEESGYMSRVTFMLDKVNRKFGLNGKSVVPLVSSVACAVPAIMAARNIDNYKDRLITIFVAPFISCSARIPVYTLLIAVAVPEKYIFGIFNLQGLVMFSMYFLGLLAAMLTALAMKFILKTGEKSYFIMELPVYRVPRWKNVGQTIIQKVNTFVYGAGKIIMVMSVVLWFLASYGQGDTFKTQKAEYQQAFDNGYMTRGEFNQVISSKKLADSYAGKFGKFIEPAIEPLGFDWRIGIALITSFAAREVFVGTMATIYSVGNDASTNTLKEKLAKEINPKTGKPFFTLPVALSLIIFYVFAMQCMSTVAVVRRETQSWKWPLIQMFYMTGMAYVSSWLVYNIMS